MTLREIIHKTTEATFFTGIVGVLGLVCYTGLYDLGVVGEASKVVQRNQGALEDLYKIQKEIRRLPRKDNINPFYNPLIGAGIDSSVIDPKIEDLASPNDSTKLKNLLDERKALRNKYHNIEIYAKAYTSKDAKLDSLLLHYMVPGLAIVFGLAAISVATEPKKNKNL